MNAPFRRPLLALPALWLLASLAFAAPAGDAPRPLTPLDLLEMPELGEHAVSPDGQWLVYAKSLLNWKEGKRYTDLFLARTDGSEHRQLTFTEKDERRLAWARDSKAFVFVSDRDSSKPQLYWLSLGPGEARKLSDEKEGVRQIEFSKDGRWLAYETGDSGPKRQIKLIDLANLSGEAAALTKHSTGVGAWRWRADSSGILFTAPEADQEIHERRKKLGFDVRVNAIEEPVANLWSVNVASKQEARLTSLDGFRAQKPKISADGRYAAFLGASTGRYATDWDQELFLVDLESGASRRVTENRQNEEDFEFSPDSRWLAYTGPQDGEEYRATKIYLVPTAGGESRKLLGAWVYDGAIGFWKPDSRGIYFAATLGVNHQLMQASVEGGEPEQLTSGAHQLRIRRDEDSGVILVALTTPTTPQELFTAKIENLGTPAQWKQVTRLAEDFSRFQLGESEAVHWSSSDGKQIEGVLIKPLGYEAGKRYPLIVQVHGGPAGTSMSGFSGSWGTYAHVFAAKGYAVFQPNYRGSSGYGDAFRRQIAGDYFRLGFDDIMTGVDALIEKGIADPDKLGHMGWSAGGHWSNWALTHTDRFKAISSGAGAVNWTSMWAQSDMQINREFYFQGKPYENPDHYREVSPITYIKNARTPTLILCGADDPRVPNAQSRELYISLQKLGVPVEYLEFPGMPHGLTKPRYQFVKMEAELAWFEKWIHGKESWLDWKALLDTVPGAKKEE
jgi:dipeptidyl aminopeptidase/acylaminoacyl peptidase